uniref:Uncharacterized protein n=1 Tax=Arundo donax TaxID=35708 RepID=A0A0A9HU31_ARUDO
MPPKVPNPACSLQYSPPPMEYPRNSDPSSSSPAYIRNGQLAPSAQRIRSCARTRLHKRVASRKIAALFLV